MIAKSDLVILTVSSVALAVGIVRWQHATTVVPSVTVPASARQAAPVPRPAAPEVTTLPARAEAVEPEPARPEPAVRRLPDPGEGAVATTPPVEPIAPSVAAAPAKPEYGVYRVRDGDYLGRIAQRHGTSVRVLRELNGIRGSTIQVGQRIRYPLPAN